MLRLYRNLTTSLHDSQSGESMFIRVGTDAKFILCEPDDFKRLHVEAADRDMALEDIKGTLGSIASFDDDNFWIDVAALKALSGRVGEAAWERGYESMIMSVQKFGWLSPDGKRVRCHLKPR
jgi:hypothetical protein